MCKGFLVHKMFNLTEEGLMRSRGWKMKLDKFSLEIVPLFSAVLVINHWNMLDNDGGLILYVARLHSLEIPTAT